MPRLDLGDRELLRHLFARTTALLEDAAVIALEGQGERLTRARAADYSRRLTDDLEVLQALVVAIAILSEDRQRR